MANGLLKAVGVGVAGGLSLLAVGAGVLWPPGQGTAESDSLRRGWPLAFQSGPFVGSVAEALQLFRSMDACAAKLFFDALEALEDAYRRLRSEKVGPGFLAEALASKGDCLRRLRGLVRRARQERAVHASDLAEEFAALERRVHDLAHNCEQQSALNAMDGFSR